jgi:hypothetical protein
VRAQDTPEWHSESSRRTISTASTRKKHQSCDEQPLLRRTKAPRLGAWQKSAEIDPGDVRKGKPLTPYFGIFCLQNTCFQYFAGQFPIKSQLTSSKSIFCGIDPKNGRENRSLKTVSRPHFVH